MHRYQMYVRIDDAWQWVAGFDAADHVHAIEAAMTQLGSGHYPLPIRLEQSVTPQTRADLLKRFPRKPL